MIFEAQRYSFIFQDAAYSMAVGFLTGFINRVLSSFLFKGKRRIFIKDIAVSFVFALLLYSYSVSFANYSVLRWYNVAAALAGLVLFSPCFDKAVQVIFQLAGAAAKHFLKGTAKKISEKIKKENRKSAKKRKKIPQNNDEEVLKVPDKLLYN